MTNPCSYWSSLVSSHWGCSPQRSVTVFSMALSFPSEIYTESGCMQGKSQLLLWPFYLFCVKFASQETMTSGLHFISKMFVMTIIKNLHWIQTVGRGATETEWTPVLEVGTWPQMCTLDICKCVIGKSWEQLQQRRLWQWRWWRGGFISEWGFQRLWMSSSLRNYGTQQVLCIDFFPDVLFGAHNKNSIPLQHVAESTLYSFLIQRVQLLTIRTKEPLLTLLLTLYWQFWRNSSNASHHPITLRDNCINNLWTKSNMLRLIAKEE